MIREIREIRGVNKIEHRGANKVSIVVSWSRQIL